MLIWLRNLDGRQRIATLLFGIGLLITCYLAFANEGDDPPSQASSALLVLITATAQGGAAWLFSGRGKPDPMHAKRAAERLGAVARRAQLARLAAEQLYEQPSRPTDMRAAMGVMSAELSFLEEGALEAFEDWRVFHPAVQALEVGRGSSGESGTD